MKQVFIRALSSALAVGILLTGCHAHLPISESPPPKRLVVQLGPDPETIDPALCSTQDTGTMVLHAFEPLLTIDEHNQIQGGQAEQWDVSPDGLVWTFHLREGLQWSDGTDLTADDFVYSWNRLADPAFDAPYARTMLGMVKGFEEAAAGTQNALALSAPDPHTLVVELSAPCPYFDKLAAFPVLCPVNRSTIEAHGSAWTTDPHNYVSNGPFKMKEWKPGSHIILEKNPCYWNKDAVKLDELQFTLADSSTTSFRAFQSGELMLTKDVPTEEIPRLLHDQESQFRIAPMMGTYLLNFNMDRPYFQDVRVRKALSLALDRDYIAELLMQETYTAADGLIGPGITDADGTSFFMDHANGGEPYFDCSNIKANLQTARQLLTEAGYPDGKGFPVIHYLVNESGYNLSVADYVQARWAKLGITVVIDSMDWTNFAAERRAGNFDIVRNGWICDYDDPTALLDPFISDNGNNIGHYSNPQFDEAMRAAAVTVDPAQRFAHLHRAEDILMEDVGLISLAYYNDYWLQNSKLKDFWHTPYGYFLFMYADLAD